MGQRDYSRAQRVGDRIQRELAELIVRVLSDPRASGVTVSGVDMSPDLKHARVYVTPRAGTDPETALAALRHAAPYLRARLGRSLRLRSLPRLEFSYDRTLDEAERVDALIEAGLPDSDPERGGRD